MSPRTIQQWYPDIFRSAYVRSCISLLDSNRRSLVINGNSIFYMSFFVQLHAYRSRQPLVPSGKTAYSTSMSSQDSTTPDGPPGLLRAATSG